MVEDPWSRLAAARWTAAALPVRAAGGGERWQFEFPAGDPFQVLVARPAGAAAPCLLLGERAIHDPAAALADAAPALADGYALVAGSFYASELPADVRVYTAAEQELWRRERAVARYLAVRAWLLEQDWCLGVRWLGGSRGAGLVAAAAARSAPADTEPVVLVAPAPWTPPSGWLAAVPLPRRGALQEIAAQQDLARCGPRLAGRRCVVVLGDEDGAAAFARELAARLGPDCRLLEVHAGHRFPLERAWAAIHAALGRPD